MRTPTALLALGLASLLTACSGSSAPAKSAVPASPAIDEQAGALTRKNEGVAKESPPGESAGSASSADPERPEEKRPRRSQLRSTREGYIDPAEPETEPRTDAKRALEKKGEGKPQPARQPKPKPIAQVVTPEFPKTVHEEYEGIRELVKRAEDAYAAYDEDSEDSARWQAANSAVSEALDRAVRFQEAHPAYPRIAEEVDELRSKSRRLEAERP